MMDLDDFFIDYLWPESAGPCKPIGGPRHDDDPDHVPAPEGDPGRRTALADSDFRVI